MNAVPRITFLPILVIWFGIGIWSKLAVVFLGAVIPITIAAYSGVKTNEARFLRVARSFGASGFKIFTSIILPGTVPFIFTTCGITLCAVLSVATVQTETTTCFNGSTPREAMVCKATMIWAATTVVSMQSCGLAAWPPLPVTTISN